MPKFDIEEYKKKLRASRSCVNCEKVPLPKLGRETRYIFVSYAHADYKKVYADLAELYIKGIPFWYDKGLPAGKNWDEKVREKMTDPRCVGIIFFLSESLFLSRSIETEIRIACGADGDELHPSIKKEYFSVNLTDLLPSQIRKNVFPRKQFPDTEDESVAQLVWLESLTNAFPDKATFLRFNDSDHIESLVEQIGVNFGVDPNYNRYDLGDAFFRSGNGVVEFNNGAVYNGDIVDGLFSGNGMLTLSDGAMYKGEWLKGKRHGYGEATFSSGTVYTGYWENGSFCGPGRLSYQDGAVYEGQWEAGRRSGQGILQYASGAVYEGQWKDGKENGRGTLKYSYGALYTGDWDAGKQNGQGTMIYPNGTVYEGQWAQGKQNGQGVMRYANGSVYEGQWKAGKQSGHGTMLNADGVIYEGQWKAGKKNGHGILTFPDGTVQNGRFENDVFIAQENE